MLMEDAVKQPYISESVKRFQIAVLEAKVKLGYISRDMVDAFKDGDQY